MRHNTLKLLLLTPLPSPFLKEPYLKLAELAPKVVTVPVFHGDASHRETTWGEMQWPGYWLEGKKKNRLKKIKEIWEAEAPDILVVSSYRSYEANYARKLALQSGVQYYMAFVEAFRPSTLMGKFVRRLLFKRFASKASGLGVMGRRAQQEYGGLFGGPIIECPYIFDLGKILSFQRPAGPREATTFLYSGRLAPFRDPMAAVRAFHKLHEIHQSKVKMVISGCGELENEIKEFISSNKLTDSVVWMNDFKDWYDLRNLYKNADVLLTIGVYNTWSLTVIEAMASGMPVIASHTTEAASAQVIHDYNGFLVQHGDIEATVEAMNNYVEKPNLLELHSERCRSIARSSSCDVVAKRLHKLITTN